MDILYTCYSDLSRHRLGRGILLVILNLFLGTAILGWTLVGTLCFPWILLGFKLFGKKSTPWITRWAIWFYGRVWQAFTRLFVRFDPIEFQANQFATPGIIVVNHRSFFDTYCMNMLPEPNICFSVRDWPFKIPIYNIFMTLAQYINIEKKTWNQSLDQARRVLASGGFVLIFPEGHRGKGKKMTRFYSGAFKMAVELGVPIIPICLTGTEDLLPPNRPYMAPAHIKTRVLDPIFPEDFKDFGPLAHQELKKTIKTTMARELDAMD